MRKYKPIKYEGKRAVSFKPDCKSWSYLYHTGAWQRLRKAHLAKEPLCIGCGKVANTVDHKKPHKGDVDLFFDPDNLQSMCKRCHDKKTGKGE